MSETIAHLCYAGLSGATSIALNMVGGSSDPARHAFVFLGRCEVHPSHLAVLEDLGCPWRSVRKRGGWDVRSYGRAGCELDAMRPAATVFHGVRTLPVVWALRRRRPTCNRVVVVHTAVELLQSWFWRQITARALRWTDAAATVSRTQKDWIETALPMARFAGRVVCIPNGLDVEFWRGPVRSDMRRPMRLTMVGSMVRAKGHDVLLRALAGLRREGRNVVLTLVGDGPERSNLHRLADTLGVSDGVEFAGALHSVDVRDRLVRTDLYVHASPAEGRSLAIMEAMLAGRPVVAAGSKGTADLIEGGRLGWMVDPLSVPGLTRAIAEAMDHPDEAVRRARAAQEKALRECNRRRMSAAIESLVESLRG